MIHITDVSLSFGGRYILDNVNLVIKPKEKIGLIGRNGAGKTTLLKLIASEITPDKGKLTVPSSLKISYLKQFIQLADNSSILDETMADFKTKTEIENTIAELQEKLEKYDSSSGDQYDSWIEELNTVFEEADSEIHIRAKAEKILKGLGFKQAELTDPINSLSGGWKMRVELARILLSEPDVLLLDEPTNYLDIESIIWFENYLQQFQGAVIIISHDETFLDNTTTLTWHITNADVDVYPYPYTKSIEYKEERQKIKYAAYKNQQKIIEEKQRVVDRFRAKASKSKMAKSMEKQLSKIERIEIDEYGNKDLNLKFNDPPRSGDIVVETIGLSKSYGDKIVFSEVDLNLERGEKIALVGRNGEGKSTLIHLITGRLDPTSGIAKLGYNVEPGVYYQDQSKLLDPSLTAYETLEQIAPIELRTKLRGILGAFLFSGEDIDKKVQILSGGEKSRLAIASLLLKPYNFLIFDEPTSHLDISSKNILKEALQAYKGTVIIVSHDRKFLKGLSDKTFEMRDGKMHIYLGDIDYFLQKRKVESFREFEIRKNIDEKFAKIDNNKSETISKRDQIKKLKRKIQYLERDIQNLESDLQNLEIEMAKPGFFDSPDHLQSIKQHTSKKELAKLKHIEWDQLVEALFILED